MEIPFSNRTIYTCASGVCLFPPPVPLFYWGNLIESTFIPDISSFQIERLVFENIIYIGTETQRKRREAILVPGINRTRNQLHHRSSSGDSTPHHTHPHLRMAFLPLQSIDPIKRRGGGYWNLIKLKTWPEFELSM